MLPMTWQQDPELSPWIAGVLSEGNRAGGFVERFVAAICAADPENFILLRPSIESIAAKYPKYFELGIAAIREEQNAKGASNG
jgi:hypothetical protein